MLLNFRPFAFTALAVSSLCSAARASKAYAATETGSYGNVPEWCHAYSQNDMHRLDEYGHRFGRILKTYCEENSDDALLEVCKSLNKLNFDIVEDVLDDKLDGLVTKCSRLDAASSYDVYARPSLGESGQEVLA